ncbi:MAG: hypothetical protein OEW12_00555 [Deltaproteobacteria bacterium]|nr:hypothetical protein [Deltaproteobacteria bacterium]
MKVHLRKWMGKTGLLLVLAVFAAGSAAWGEEFRGMVSLKTTYRQVDTQNPWNKRNEDTILGNAVVAGKGILLTTSDMVKNAALIQVRKFGRYPDYKARLLKVDYELDMALLAVDSPEFWKDLQPLPLAAKPITAGRFVINRWRSNGRFEQGTGEVVDVRISSSRYGSMEIPALRASTNMTGLGWAEVLTVNGEVVGMVSSHNRQEIQGNLSPLMRLFVEGATSGKKTAGFAHRGFAWQQTNHPAITSYLGLKPGSPGVLVRKVYPNGTGAGELKVGDILVVLGRYYINPEGQISHPDYGLVQFTLAINESLDKTIPAVVVRDGQIKKLELTRKRFKEDDYRINPYQFDSDLDYEVFGGLVLQELNLEYLRSFGDNWQTQAPPRLVMEFGLNSLRETPAVEKVLIVSKVLPDESILGYENSENAMVTKMNGIPVHSLQGFREAIKTPVDGYQILETMPGQGRAKLVFKADQMEASNRRVGELYDVPFSGNQKMENTPQETK